MTTDTARYAAVLAEMVAVDAPHGWDSYYVSDPDGVVAWFAYTRTAAKWVASQDPRRRGTGAEYRVRPTPATGKGSR